MRQVVLDTETTGLEVQRGHRVIEIGCVELVQRRRTGRDFHTWLNPDRSIDEGARAVTGISDESLRDKPRFEQVAQELLQFIDGAELIAHNASFDLAFLDAEFARAGMAHIRVAERTHVVDTLELARERFPGQRNSLDALCKRLDVDNSHRQLHGALLDANLLVDVYLALTAGQGALGFDEQAMAADAPAQAPLHVLARPMLLRADAEEAARHEARLDAIERASKGQCVWRRG
ncbi:MAG: DNA polymerase III subunit epsilon [Xanthomonadales bacterium]|nr:DNA polymerase III subunit epsilon [Xanthomonadales bacterium]MDL1870305.1 DNA polymerase III subunit epsilon [Gammaproteobacteria bacterium PRO6]